MARKVIFIRGPQGAGKSTLTVNAGLYGFSISQDRIREIIAGDTLGTDGRFTPSHENEKQVHDLMRASIDHRIDNGELVCIEGTLANGNLLYDYWQRFERAGYQGLVVDLFGFDPELRARRNMARPARVQVPESNVDRINRMADQVPVPPIMANSPSLTFISARNDAEIEQAQKRISTFLVDPRCHRDLSRYDRVVHIGDLQGTFSPLAKNGSPLASGFDDKTFYVFLGDLFDRGVENGAVGAWFVREAIDRPNVALIAGNHEDYVEKQAAAGKADLDLPASEWVRFTWPALQESGLTHKDCRRIAAMSQDYLAYHWRGKDVLCSHAGFVRWPSALEHVSVRQLRRGNGHYDIDVDTQWSINEKGTGRYQIHGHRNSAMVPTIATPLSMNLEGQVEFGGHMRFVTLDEGGFSSIDIRPEKFRTMQDDIAANAAVNRQSASRHAPIAPWIEKGNSLPKVSGTLIEKMKNHSMISIKASGRHPGVVSVNFTHKAFNDAAWDDYTTMARGLYLDCKTGTVVARSYEKFFNLNERPETDEKTIAQAVSYPVTAFSKSNGFLCITGYSERLDELVIASKSVTEGEFPDIARDVIKKTIGAAGMERLFRFNRDQQASLVFEIEDPERDPHIIALDKPNIVLLACVRRSEQFEQVGYPELKKIADWLGCEVKQQVAVLPNEKALASFNRRVVHDPNWVFNGAPIEGCVMEDNAGFFYKLKSHYYRNWKRMRSAVDHVRKAKLAEREISFAAYDDAPGDCRAFLDWVKTLSIEALEHDIVSLRASFLGDRSIMEEIHHATEARLAAEKAAETEKQFNQLVETLADNDKITSRGLVKFIERSMADQVKANLLRKHERFDELLGRVETELGSRHEPGQA